MYMGCSVLDTTYYLLPRYSPDGTCWGKLKKFVFDMSRQWRKGLERRGLQQPLEDKAPCHLKHPISTYHHLVSPSAPNSTPLNRPQSHSLTRHSLTPPLPTPP